MLPNAYFLAKFRFDTAENEPAKILQNFAKFCKNLQNFAKFCKTAFSGWAAAGPSGGHGAAAAQ